MGTKKRLIPKGKPLLMVRLAEFESATVGVGASRFGRPALFSGKNGSDFCLFQHSGGIFARSAALSSAARTPNGR
ncbi:MAG: hypothetical protein Q4C72_09610 [Eubacteriales bacterium]|nr:hypothetical protein [Eubacteriales bacterium]